MRLAALGRLVKSAAYAWIDDQAASMGAAIAFYTIFSLAPMLILVIAIAGFVFGQQAAEGAIVRQLTGLVGEQAAATVQALVKSASDLGTGVTATIVGLGTMLLGATAVFGELQTALNAIWKTKPPPESAIWAIIRARLLSLSLILGIGFLLIVSLVISAALAAIGDYLTGLLAGIALLLGYFNEVLSFVVIAALFAMIYKILPDVDLAWRDVVFGAAVTSLLFTIGKFLIGLYIGNSGVASAYGAAGTVIIILLWVYYSAQIFLFGAELTKAWVEARKVRCGTQTAAPSS